MDREKSIIKPFLGKYNGDDAAVIKSKVYSCDLFCENVHFKRDWMSYKQIGAKAMLVNISDTIVMNALPKYALLGLSIPKSLPRQASFELCEGILEVAKQYKVQIIGGDTISSPNLNICISIIGELLKKPVLRKGLVSGDLLAFTGKLGSSQDGLSRLKCGLKIHKNHRFIKPVLRDRFFYQVASRLRCAMDISDGLAKDLSRMLEINHLGVKYTKRLSKSVLTSGEEYELLLAFPRKNLPYLQAIAKKSRLSLNVFGVVKRKKHVYHGKEHHF